MEWVDGVVLRTRADATALTPGQASGLSERFVDMMATIHGVDVAAVGLTGFGRPEGYLARQLARWQRQWELSATREMPGYAELVKRLDEGLSGRGGQHGGDGGQHGGDGGQHGGDGGHPAGTLVHGDFRIDNMLVALGPKPAIAAVVDWEMSTLGDPLADLGLTLVYWTDPGEQDLLELTGEGGLTGAPGFWTRARLAERYAETTGRDLSRS
jgi:aminoglycoside phosphotransferase (APT) family kinase protein